MSGPLYCTTWRASECAHTDTERKREGDRERESESKTETGKEKGNAKEKRTEREREKETLQPLRYMLLHYIRYIYDPYDICDILYDHIRGFNEMNVC